jgi:hydrogenase expression/formation protein HypC
MRPAELPLAAKNARPVADCHDDVCITCSDGAISVRIVEMLPGELARVDTGQSIEEVSVALVDAREGDVVLVHAKEAIALVDAIPGVGS